MSSGNPRAPRSTIAQHGVLRSPGPTSQFFRILAIAVVTVVVAGIGTLAFVAQDFTSRLSASAVDIGGETPPDVGEIKGGVNILVAGTDVCEPQYAQYFGDRCGDAAEEGARSDVNLLVHISDEPRKVTVISFPRDLMVAIPSCTNANGEATPASDYAMINSAFDTGGLGCTVATIEQLTSLDIQYAASVNWGGVIDITNAVGGVTVCLAAGIQDEHTGIDWPAGNRTVQGLEALQFLRTRHGVGDGGDLGRISNQQQYLSRLAKKLMSSEVLSNPMTVLKLANSAIDAIDPSTSLNNPHTILKLANTVKDVPFEDIVFVQYPTDVDPNDSNRVVPNESGAAALLAALQSNKPIVLTGKPGAGVVAEGQAAADPSSMEVPAATEQPTDPATGEAAADGTAVTDPNAADGSTTPTIDPNATEAVLPSQVTGTTAAQNTCSNGNMRE